MCIYTHGSRVFMIARVNLLSLAARLTTVSLDDGICHYGTGYHIQNKHEIIGIQRKRHDALLVVYTV